MHDQDVDAELSAMWIALIRVREQASALGFEMLLYLVSMCIDEVRLEISKRQKSD